MGRVLGRRVLTETRSSSARNNNRDFQELNRRHWAKSNNVYRWLRYFKPNSFYFKNVCLCFDDIQIVERFYSPLTALLTIGELWLELLLISGGRFVLKISRLRCRGDRVVYTFIYIESEPQTGVVINLASLCYPGPGECPLLTSPGSRLITPGQGPLHLIWGHLSGSRRLRWQCHSKMVRMNV